jgi:hypothetical protein
MARAKLWRFMIDIFIMILIWIALSITAMTIFVAIISALTIYIEEKDRQ